MGVKEYLKKFKPNLWRFVGSHGYRVKKEQLFKLMEEYANFRVKQELSKKYIDDAL